MKESTIQCHTFYSKFHHRLLETHIHIKKKKKERERERKLVEAVKLRMWRHHTYTGTTFCSENTMTKCNIMPSLFRFQKNVTTTFFCILLGREH
jgi:hypothetical protein